MMEMFLWQHLKSVDQTGVLDFGCSYHICVVREQFDGYRACDGGTIMMANCAESKIVGIGSVQCACLMVLCKH